MCEPGLHVLHDEHHEGSETEIDVVAVHGLNFKNNPQHALATWTWSATGALWIRDFLPAALGRRCRVLLFAYNSSPAMGAAALRLDEHARTLLRCLLEKRKGMEERPIVFLCHSLGGIVVKSALVEAKLMDTYISIVHATRLLVFFATPHRGGKYSSIGDAVARVVRTGLGTPANDLLDGLKAGSGDVVKRIEQFRHVAQGCLVISFYETLDYKHLGLIVEQESAVLGLPDDREKQVPLQADHSKVCKFPTAAKAEPVTSLISVELERALKIHLAAENVHWLVPRRGSPLFIGREDLAQGIIRAILPGTPHRGPKTSQRVFVLTGMGGQGKSEVCLHVANQVRASFWGVFWVDASSWATAAVGFAKIADALGSEAHEIKRVCLLLSKQSRRNNWLLVLDNANADDIGLRELMPSGDRGTVLLASRDPECKLHSTIGHEEVGSLGAEECVSLLLKASRAPQDSWADLHPAATGLVRDLGFHTLALVQAGAFIARGGCTMQEYLALIRKQRDEVLGPGAAQLESEYRNVYATVEVSIKALEDSARESAHDALELLHLLSAMHHADIPLQIFKDVQAGMALARRNAEDDTIDRLSGWHVKRLPRFLAEEDGDTGLFRLFDALKHLRALALGERLVDSRGAEMLSLHPLIHGWIRTRQSREQRSAVLQSYCCFVSLWTYGQLPWTPYRDRFGPHLSSLLGVKESKSEKERRSAFLEDALSSPLMRQSLFQVCRLLDDMQDHKELETLLHAILESLKLAPECPTDGFLQLYLLEAISQYNLGRIKESISVLSQILEKREVYTPESESLRRTTVEALARSYLADGQTNQAVAMFEDMDQAPSKGRGPDGRSRLFTKYRTGIAYRAAGQIDKAMALMEDVASLGSMMLEQGDPGRAATAYELARCLLRAGRPKDALRHLEAAIEEQEEFLPETHPIMISLRSGLGRALTADFRVPAAIEVLERVSDVESSTNGLDHPGRLANLVTLGLAYQSNGQTREAIRAYEEVLRRSKFDDAHPTRLQTQLELSGSYLAIGKTQKALSLLERTWSLQQESKAQDRGHPSRSRVQILLGHVCSLTGQSERGIRLLEDAVELQRAQGAAHDHPIRLEAQYYLGLATLRDGQEKRAIAILEDVVRIEASSLDDDNPDRAVSKLALGRGYLADGRAREAARIFEEMVALLESLWGRGHPDVLTARHELARSHFAVGKIDQAKVLFEEVVEAQAAILPADHPDQLASQRLLSLTLLQLGRNEDALALLEKVHGAEGPDALPQAESVLETRRALAKAYLANGHASKATELYKDVLRVQCQTLAPRHPDALDTRRQLGVAYLALDQTKDAVALLEHAASGYAESHEQGHPARLAAEHSLATAYMASGQLPLATRVLEAAVANGSHLEAGHPGRRAVRYDLAQCYLHSGRTADALRTAQAVLAAEDATLRRDDPSRLRTVRLLGHAYLSGDMAGDAIRCFAEVAETLGARDAQVQHDLAVAYRDDSRPKRAASVLREALAALDPADAPRAAMLFELAAAYMDMNKPRRAIPLLQQVMEIKTRNAGVAHPAWDTLRAALATSRRADTMLYKLLFLCGLDGRLRLTDARVGRE